MPDAPATPARSIFKNALRGSVIYSIPIVAQRLAAILLLSIVTRVLTPDDYGLLALLDQVTTILSTLLGVHFASALGYFYFQAESQQDRAQVVGTAVGGALAIGSLAGLVCFSVSGLLAQRVFGSSEALHYLPLVAVSMPVGFLLEALLAWLRVTDRQGEFAAASGLRLVLQVGGIAVLVGLFKLHVIAYMASNLAAVVSASAVLVVFLLRAAPIAWSQALFWKMARFSLPLSLSWIAMFVINFGDQFVLRHYHALAEVGIYALAYRISMLVNVAISSFYSYWNAQVYQVLRREDSEAVFARFLTYCVLLVSALAVVLIVCATPGLRILVAPPFRPASSLIPLLVAANSIRAVSEFVRTRFLAEGRPKYETYCVWGGTAVCVSFYLLLIPRYGSWGAATATLLTFVAMAIVSVIWTYRLRPYTAEGARLLKIAGVTAAIVALASLVPVSSLWAQLAWTALLLVSFPAGLYALRFATPGELQAIRSMAGKYLCVSRDDREELIKKSRCASL